MYQGHSSLRDVKVYYSRGEEVDMTINGEVAVLLLSLYHHRPPILRPII